VAHTYYDVLGVTEDADPMQLNAHTGGEPCRIILAGCQRIRRSRRIDLKPGLFVHQQDTCGDRGHYGDQLTIY
jgi:hypothetical protein